MVLPRGATLLLLLGLVWGENLYQGRYVRTPTGEYSYRPLTNNNGYQNSNVPFATAQSSIPSMRGGGNKKNMALTTTATSTRQNINYKASQTMDSVKDKMRRFKKSQALAMIVLRVAFIILTPISAALFLLGFALSFVLTLLRVLTFDHILTDEAILVYAVTRALQAIMVASAIGFILPLFAVFGLVASLTASGCEIAEPLLRIRYKRQLRKLRHLHKLLTDPVLMETMEALLRGAQAVSVASKNRVTATSRRAVGAGRQKAGQLRATSREMQMTSLELVETLLESSGAVALKDKVEKRMPPSVILWTRDQWASLRQSGILEEAAARALDALEKELQGAAAFLPYLEAIGQVHAQQDQQKRKRRKKGWY